jgi:hypothetical protein
MKLPQELKWVNLFYIVFSLQIRNNNSNNNNNNHRKIEAGPDASVIMFRFSEGTEL